MTVRLLLLTLALAVLFTLNPWPADGSPSRNESVAAIHRVFGPSAWKAIRVARCESGLNARAENRTDRHSDGSVGSFGLLQIGAIHRARGESVAAFRLRMFRPLENARVAYRLSGGGRVWSPWLRCSRIAGVR